MSLSGIKCVGITIPAAQSYPTRELAGHKLQDLPGGLFVMGSSRQRDVIPRWVYLDPYSGGQTAVREDQYRNAMGRAGRADVPQDHPVTMVSYNDARAYLEARGSGLRLLTEAEWENAARGPAVNMQQAMEEETGKFTPKDFVDFAEGRFENFVFGIVGQIYTNPAENRLFRKLIEQGLPFYGWRMYGTPSGRLNRDEAWFKEKGITSVEWGPVNAYGLKGMTGGIWEYVHDWYAEVDESEIWNPTGPKNGFIVMTREIWEHLDGWYGGVNESDIGNPINPNSVSRVMRGGAWYSSDPDDICAASRSMIHPDSPNIGRGFRVASSLSA